MKKIRLGVFETNSSSTHTICICTKDEFIKWVAGDILCDIYDNKFATPEEVEDMDEFDSGCYLTYEDWEYDDEDRYEYYEEEYTTASGDEIVIFGKYGYDG